MPVETQHGTKYSSSLDSFLYEKTDMPKKDTILAHKITALGTNMLLVYAYIQ